MSTTTNNESVPIEAPIEELVTQLEAIAEKNNDEFDYQIDISPSQKQGTPLSYRFVAFERADGHDFVVGHGHTIEEAVADAEQSVEVACKSWGYKL